MPPRFRSSCIVLLLALGAPTLAAAQLMPREAPLPESFVEHVRGEPAARATLGLGWSGAVRVVIAEPGALLEVEAWGLAAADWGQGHRWIPIRSEGGPALLGEPKGDGAAGVSYAFAPLRPGGVSAPEEPGAWLLESRNGSSVSVITQVPAVEVRGGHLNGYHIGTYPTAGSGRTDVYAPPTAFIEVTPENRDLQISEHLVLGQFLTKDQFDVWPKYVALDLRLIDKLELVIQELNAMGVRADRMHVMSGFRTPQYNGPGGGGRAALSRHMWGAAADVWIDNVGDGQMDDLNGDGRIDLDDAAVVMRAVERVERRYPELIGGAGTYPHNSARGPYIHIDVRGYRSRW